MRRAAAWMPPAAYAIAAIGLAGLIVASMAVRPGLAIILWPWALATAACVLGIVGAFRIVVGVGAPRWTAAALVLPGYLWAVNAVKLLSDQPVSLMERVVFGAAAQLAFLAAAAGALRLVEWLLRPRAIFRAGYAILAGFAVFACVESALGISGWSFAKTAYWLTPFLAMRAAATVVAYLAFVGAALTLSMRRDGERWTGIVIIMIAAHMLYDAMRLTLVLELRGHAESLFGSILMLAGAAAVWRMGALLRAPDGAEGRADAPISGVI